MELNFEQAENRCRIKIAGELTIEQASAFREAMLKALAQNSDIYLDLCGVSRIDMSCLQIICSMHKTLVDSGRGLSLTERSKPFRETLKRSGFTGHQGCLEKTDIGCLWAEETE